MTNGEKLIEIFPNNTHITLKRTTQFAINPMTINQQMIVVDNDFWNAEYKEPTTKKDCNTCTHNNETDGSNCYECVKDMCNNYEPTTKNDIRDCKSCIHSKDAKCAGTEECHECMWDNKYSLKNDLGVDCISRKRVLEWLENATDDSIEHALDSDLEFISSVTPQEPRWIPVSERMPEEDTDVLVTLKCGLIGIMQKKLADDDNGEPCYIWQDFEGEEHEVIAWMPLPQSYREVEE